MSTLESVQRWAKAMREHGSRKPYPAPVMAPRDEFKWFQQPALNSFTLGAGPAPLLIAQANPDRIGIVIYQNSGAGATVGPSQKVAIGKGILLAATNLPLSFSQNDYGNLVQVEWYAVQPNAGAAVTVIEVLLRDWPS